MRINPNKDPYDETYFQKNPGMQNICKSVHLDFNDTSMSNDELADDLSDIFFGFDEFDFPDSKNDSVDRKNEQKVDIHIGEIC